MVGRNEEELTEAAIPYASARRATRKSPAARSSAT